uniref:Uncharacterized protein n=1 Tax=Oryza meridionalis TaxID=40149 RepID=A0A0E0DPI9_9ORYZ
MKPSASRHPSSSALSKIIKTKKRNNGRKTKYMLPMTCAGSGSLLQLQRLKTDNLCEIPHAAESASHGRARSCREWKVTEPLVVHVAAHAIGRASTSFGGHLSIHIDGGMEGAACAGRRDCSQSPLHGVDERRRQVPSRPPLSTSSADT